MIESPSSMDCKNEEMNPQFLMGKPIAALSGSAISVRMKGSKESPKQLRVLVGIG